MKKIMIAAGCMAMTFAMTTLSFGIQLSPEQATALQSSAKGMYVSNVEGGKITYTKVSTAYFPSTLDTILKGYGLSLESNMVADLPSDYATMKDGKVVFTTKLSTAYTPQNYHAIFTAYGLVLDPACIKATIGKIPYALAVTADGKVTLSNVSTAFTGEHYADILACYNLPPKPVVKEKVAHTGWVVASDYLFAFDKAVIKKQYYSKLDEVAAEIKKDPTLKVEIQGHTDSIGTEKYNMGLSLRRANAVRNYLIKKGGIAADRLTAVGFGETKPVASNKTKAGRAKNRRVELKPIGN